MSNISSDDLKEISISLAKKPKLNPTSLDSMARAINFGTPKTEIEKDPLLEPNINKPVSKTVKINIASPKIAKRPVQADPTQKKLVQEIEVDRLVKGEFSSNSISFIPYGAGFISAKEALDKIQSDYANFKVVQKNYLSLESINLIISKIDKIFDLDANQKSDLRNFYTSLYSKKQNLKENSLKAQSILSKIKGNQFRINLSKEVQRMMPNSGDLYLYYKNFNLIDEETKGQFLEKIVSIDAYIIKKIKEIVTLNQNDLNYCFDEILNFIEIINERNILMHNFHEQVNHLTQQKISSEKYLKMANQTLQNISQVAKDFGKSGKFGREILRSSNLINSFKNNYFILISQIIEPNITILNKIIFNINTGNYPSLESVKSHLDQINIDQINLKCKEIYDQTLEKSIK